MTIPDPPRSHERKAVGRRPEAVVEQRVKHAAEIGQQARAEAAEMDRKQLEAHYAMAISNWNIALDELDELRKIGAHFHCGGQECVVVPAEFLTRLAVTSYGLTPECRAMLAALEEGGDE